MYHYQIPEIEIRYKNNNTIKKKITNSKDCYEIMKDFFNDDTFDLIEELVVLYFDTSNQTLGWFRVSQGGISSSVVDPRIIFGIGLKAGASSMIISHNHPSGQITPSPADNNITRKLVKGGKLLGINLLDHIVVTRTGYYSYADHGELH